MEPGDLRESPAGSRDPDVGEWREETPGLDAEMKGGGEPSGKDEGTAAEQQTEEDELHSPPHDEELDPRIQEELEHLNEASAEINRLELQLDDARSGYRKILTDSARKLNAHISHLGTCIEKARPYYESRRLAKEAQQETQKAALSFERAVSMHTAAREMVYVAEQGLLADGKNTLDPTWQEMLNHATSKVNEAEEERVRSEREHMRVTHACQEAEARVQTLQKSLKRVIFKSKPYFELKAQFNHILEEHKTKVLALEEKVSKVKACYSVALHNLEKISEHIHAQRGRGQANGVTSSACGGRSPPVGAESDSEPGKGAEGGGACGGEASTTTAAGGRDTADGSGSGREDKTSEPPPAAEERHRERESEAENNNGGGVERAGSDSLSVFSLQTIASDLEKCDSVEHLGDFSDVGSVTGDDGERGAGPGGAGGRAGPPTEAQAKERQQLFLKQHHRSFSL